MNIWILVVIFCAILGGIAQLSFKGSLEPIQPLKLMIGFMLYGIAFVLYLASLRHLEVSIAYSLISLSYIVVAIGSWQLFNEDMNYLKATGFVMLIFSVYLIGK